MPPQQSGGHHIKPFSRCVRLCKCEHPGSLLRFPNLLLPLPCQVAPACRPQKQLRPAPGLGLWIFCACSEFVTRTGKATSTPGAQFCAFCSGFHEPRRLLPSRRKEFNSPGTTAELPVLLTENDNCQAAGMIIRTGAFRRGSMMMISGWEQVPRTECNGRAENERNP